MKECRTIINRLLDKYENSKHLLEPGGSKRRVMLQIGQRDLPEYTYETAEVRDRFNRAARELAQQNLVLLEWIPSRPVLSLISLNLDQISTAYTLAERVHPKVLSEAICRQIQEVAAKITTPWIQDWCGAICQKAKERYQVPGYCKDHPAFLPGLLHVLQAYDGLRGEAISMRAFSIQCFQDSKRFEREYRDEFLRIAQQYDAGLQEACTRQTLGPRERLAYLGIYAHPEHYALSRPCSICTESGVLNLSPAIPFGIALPSTLVDGVLSFDLSAIAQVTFIENKTNYEEYLLSERAEHELVIYHGGFLSPQKRKLFQKLAQPCQHDLPVFFWADIDLGGFQMFRALQAVLPELQPMRMGAAEVERYHAFGLVRPPSYLKQVELQLAAHQYPLFEEAMVQIMKYGVTIEQEVFLQ